MVEGVIKIHTFNDANREEMNAKDGLGGGLKIFMSH